MTQAAKTPGRGRIHKRTIAAQTASKSPSNSTNDTTTNPGATGAPGITARIHRASTNPAGRRCNARPALQPRISVLANTHERYQMGPRAIRPEFYGARDDSLRISNVRRRGAS